MILQVFLKLLHKVLRTSTLVAMSVVIHLTAFSVNVVLIDSLFDEFAGELTLLKSIPSGIDETDFVPCYLLSLRNEDIIFDLGISPLIYPEPCYNQDFNFPQYFQDVPQQYTCCDDCGVTHDAYQCQPMNEVYDYGQNSCYDSTSIIFDQSEPQQYTVNHPIFNAHNNCLDSQVQLNNTLAKITEQMTSITSWCEIACQFVQKKLEEKQLEEEQAAKAQNWKPPVCCDDDDDEESSNSVKDNIISELSPYSAVTPNEPVDSLIMGDEHHNTILATESDEFIKSCVENLVPNPSNDDQSLPDEDVPEKIYSNPLFDEEIIPMEIDPHFFNAESDLIKSMLNNDSSIIIPSKIDSLFDEFAGELILLKSIPPGIDVTDCHPEEEIHFTKRLLYDNSSPRPPEEFVSNNSNADIKSSSPSPILIKDSDSHMEEIDLSLNPVEPNSRDFAKDVVENIL
nr:hypothetical protein [Tanacetum cinerariifolium]